MGIKIKKTLDSKTKKNPGQNRVSIADKDPNKHLTEFHVVCSSMKPQGISEEQVKLIAFSFSLVDSVNE